MTEKYLVGMPPRQGKTVTMEMLKQINEQPINIKYEFPIENVTADPKALREALAKMAMPVTNQKCPDCGNPLRFDHETECKVVLYCIHCDHKIMARKG